MSIIDAKNAFIRFSKNSLLICHICGGVFRIVGYLGYYVVKPKYIEIQYRQSASSASFFTGNKMNFSKNYHFKIFLGAASVATMAIGTMAGGILIRYSKPSARSIAIFVVLVEFLSGLAIFGGMFLQCPTPQFYGLELLNPSLATNGPLDNNYNCNSDCNCQGEVYQPVCSQNGLNYFSPCFAGCKSTYNEPGIDLVVCDN